MPGRLAVDFGTSNTVVAAWDEVYQEGVPLHVPGYGHLYQHGGEQVSVVPSLIHYAEDRRRWVGTQVIERNLSASPRTFRWMKRYIAVRSPGRVRLDGREVSHLEAGKDFLSSVLIAARTELGMGDEEIALTVPVEAYEHYEEWLTQVAEQAGMPRFRLIDEPSAAALGYGAHVQPNDVYLIFDFGGGTLDVAVVLVEDEGGPVGGQRCRVLGKAGAELGGATIDRWLFEEVLRTNARIDTDEDVRQMGNALLVECERAKVKLTDDERAEIGVIDPGTGAVLGAELTRQQFEELLDRHDAFAHIDQTIRRALNAARERGYDEERIKEVLMVGGSSLIPSVQRTVQRIFGRERVKLRRPLDAVARGAAAFVAGMSFCDHIQHDYAIRYVDARTGQYAHRTLVKRGTPYPTSEQVERLTVRATYDGQRQLGIAIFELGERFRRGESAIELVFDLSGAPRLAQIAADEADDRSQFWMNEGHPTFLHADPAAQRGEARFEIEFGIDGNKRLLLTARDLKTGRVTHRDYPVVKLT